MTQPGSALESNSACRCMMAISSSCTHDAPAIDPRLWWLPCLPHNPFQANALSPPPRTTLTPYYSLRACLVSFAFALVRNHAADGEGSTTSTYQCPMHGLSLRSAAWMCVAVLLAVVRRVDAFIFAGTRPPATSLKPQVRRRPVWHMNAATPDEVSSVLETTVIETACNTGNSSHAKRLYDFHLCIRAQSRHSCVPTCSLWGCQMSLLQMTIYCAG